MSKHSTGSEITKPLTEPTNLAEVPDAQTGLAGGTFRLDAMSPGSETAAASLAAPRKTSLLTQLVFFLILVVAAGGVVFSMRKIGIGPLKSFAQMQMPDYDVTKSSAKSADHQRILEDLSRAATTVQVPADKVQKNPFRLADSMGAEPEPTDDSKKTEQQRLAALAKAQKEADARAKSIDAKLGQLKIHSIMRGSNPVARVNDDFVRVGDLIDELFTVKAINERSLEVEADGVVYLLSLDEQPSQKGARRKK